MTTTVMESGARTVVRRPRLGRKISALFLIIAVLWVVSLFVRSPEMQWALVPTYMFDPRILQGLLVTVALTLISFFLSLVGGAVLALMSVSDNRVFTAFAAFYVWIFRAVPLIVQLIFWFNIALVLPTISIGSQSWSTNDLVTPFVAALLGLTLHEVALSAEVMRAGILSVPPGQTEAALMLGMTRLTAKVRIVLPQTVRVIIPPLGNQFIGLLKGTALVAVIGAGDLLTEGQRIYAQNYAVVPVLAVVTLWYLALTLLATVGQRMLEQRLEPTRDSRRRRQPSASLSALRSREGEV